MHFVYMIKNSVNKLYIGISENPKERVEYHNSNQGARFTKYNSIYLNTNIPYFKIVFLEQYSTISQARQREIQLKKWRREKKEILIEKYQSGLNTKIT